MDRLSDVVNATLSAVEKGKEEIFNIYETTRSEAQRLEKELTILTAQLGETIKEVDEKRKKEKFLRKKLMEVNKNYSLYDENSMIEVYAEAKDSQVDFQLLQAKEIQLRTRRDELERSLRNLDGTVKKAENLMNQVSLAISILKDGLTEITNLHKNDQNKEIALRIMKVQEEERLRVAREVHDGPAQSFANIVLRLEIAEKLLEVDQEKVLLELQDLKHLVRDNLKSIRRIIFDLRPINLENTGIIESIKNYIKNYEKMYGLTCELIIRGRERQISSSMQVALFRLVQEGMTNVAKHAESASATVTLDYSDKGIKTRITDYGKGFNPEEILDNPGEHFGLIGIKERVEMFSGKFSVESIPGKGSVFEFELPYSK